MRQNMLPLEINLFYTTFSFQKQDELTGGEPLEGLFLTCFKGGMVLYTAISMKKGEINFGSFTPGTYTLREQNTPAGYHMNEHEYTVSSCTKTVW